MNKIARVPDSKALDNSKVLDNSKALELLEKRLLKEGSLIFHIKTAKKENKIVYDSSQAEFVLEIRGKPIEGKANKEIISFLRRLTKKRVEIISGLKSKTKKIKFS